MRAAMLAERLRWREAGGFTPASAGLDEEPDSPAPGEAPTTSQLGPDDPAAAAPDLPA